MWLALGWLLQSILGSTTWSHTYSDGTIVLVESIADGIVRVRTIPRGAAKDFTHIKLTKPQPGTPPSIVAKSNTGGWQLVLTASDPSESLVVDVSAAAPLSNVSRADGTLLSEEVGRM